MNRRLAVLISGRGSNLQSIIDAITARTLDATVAIVISNRADAQGLNRARDAGIEAVCVAPGSYAGPDVYDRALVEILRSRDVGLVCLAGYMRIVGKHMLDAYTHSILNIHPSLLPSFPGLHGQRQALEYGVKVSGATVHLVTSGLDDGPIVLQSAVPVQPDDTVETLSARILVEEHRIYPEAVAIILDGGWALDGRRFVRPRQAEA